uniref:MADF domain-containing protein n=1 Tax=Clastoptera arizonana TaxID=38151 RepID=A0A1B6DG67_9HEMI
MNQDDSTSEALDVETLLFLVENNPAIFNYTLREHHNVDVMTKIWTDIGNVMNVPGDICRNKWNNLRRHYVQYQTKLKKMHNSSTPKKRKWHLADAMEFLLPWIRPSRNRKKSGNLDKCVDFNIASPSTEESFSTDDFITNDVSDKASEEVENYSLKKEQRKTPDEFMATTMPENLKTITNKHQPQDVTEENEFLSFFNILIPDAERLSTKRKRKFKTLVMSKLHQLLDEQEDEQAHYDNDISSYSDKLNSQDME